MKYLLLILLLSGCCGEAQVGLLLPTESLGNEIYRVDRIGKAGLFEIYGYCSPGGTIWIKNRNLFEWLLFPVPDSWIIEHELRHREKYRNL